MRLWLNVIASLILAFAAVPEAQAAAGAGGSHGGGGGHAASQVRGQAASRQSTGGQAPGSVTPNSLASVPSGGAGQPRPFFRPVRQGYYGSGGVGYAIPSDEGYGYPALYPHEGDARAAGERRLPIMPLYTYGYERPPQLTCFRPRLIVIGKPVAQRSRLPKLVYGGPLPCGFRGI